MLLEVHILVKANQGVCLVLYAFENKQEALQLLSPAVVCM